MKMFNLPEYILRGRRQAIVTALLCALIPLMNWLSLVVMSFVALRKGPKEGFIVLLWISLTGIMYTAFGGGVFFLENILLTGLLTLAISAILHYRCSWTPVIKACAYLGKFAEFFSSTNHFCCSCHIDSS